MSKWNEVWFAEETQDTQYLKRVNLTALLTYYFHAGANQAQWPLAEADFFPICATLVMPNWAERTIYWYKFCARLKIKQKYTWTRAMLISISGCINDPLSFMCLKSWQF